MSCISALDGHLEVAAYYIAAGAFFDLLDGMFARMLGVSNPLGKQLDSLADMVSFGVAPGLIARELILMSVFIETGDITMSGWTRLLPFLPLAMIAFSALRLAKFNIDESQSVDFKGLPTPANALFWLAIPLSIPLDVKAEGGLGLLQDPLVLGLLCIVMGLIMVSRMELFSLKFDRSDKSRFTWQIILLASGAILFAIFRFAALPLVIVLYLLLSFIRNRFTSHEVQS